MSFGRGRGRVRERYVVVKAAGADEQSPLCLKRTGGIQKNPWDAREANHLVAQVGSFEGSWVHVPLLCYPT